MKDNFYNYILTLKNLFSKKRGRWSVGECYANVHSEVEFKFIYKSLTVWMITRDGGKWWSKEHHLVVIKQFSKMVIFH